MLIPFRTDAPIYYWPYATVGLIVVNCLVLGAMMTGSFEDPELWILEHGRLSPLQWVSSNFIHGGPLHLLGNMFFLWGFGPVNCTSTLMC
jgi:membrane associated rhomboid family serine protease